MTIRITTYVLSAVVALVMVSCADLSIDDVENTSQVFTFTFDNDAEEWVGGFSDYPPPRDETETKGLDFSYSDLPDDAGLDASGLYLTGAVSGDLFMFVKRKFDGLKPDSAYYVDIAVEGLATMEIGDMMYDEAGEPLAVKVGATTIEPVSVLADGSFQMNIAKDPETGKPLDMFEIGDVKSEPVFGPEQHYNRFSFANRTPIVVKTDEDGGFWAIVGTDSPRGLPTEVYYTGITLELYE